MTSRRNVGLWRSDAQLSRQARACSETSTGCRRKRPEIWALADCYRKRFSDRGGLNRLRASVSDPELDNNEPVLRFERRLSLTADGVGERRFHRHLLRHHRHASAVGTHLNPDRIAGVDASRLCLDPPYLLRRAVDRPARIEDQSRSPEAGGAQQQRDPDGYEGPPRRRPSCGGPTPGWCPHAPSISVLRRREMRGVCVSTTRRRQRPAPVVRPILAASPLAAPIGAALAGTRGRPACVARGT